MARLGFGLEDIRRLTIQDMVVLTDLAFSDAGTDASASIVREATQADIDRFLA